MDKVSHKFPHIKSLRVCVIALLLKSGGIEHERWFTARRGREPLCICWWWWQRCSLDLLLLVFSRQLTSPSHSRCLSFLCPMTFFGSLTVTVSCDFFLCVFSAACLFSHWTVLSYIFRRLRNWCSQLPLYLFVQNPCAKPSLQTLGAYRLDTWAKYWGAVSRGIVRVSSPWAGSSCLVKAECGSLGRAVA